MKWFEALVGPPMAAPETPVMRYLRYAFIGAAGLSALSIGFVGVIARLIGRAAAGGVLLALLLATVLLALVFFVRKTCADDAWFANRHWARSDCGEREDL